jgi:hypothetical protein
MRIGYFLSSEELVSEDMVAEAVPCGPDLEKHLRAIGRYRDAGFDQLYIQQIGPSQDGFFETHAREVLPRFNDSQAPALRSAAA